MFGDGDECVLLSEFAYEDDEDEDDEEIWWDWPEAIVRIH